MKKNTYKLILDTNRIVIIYAKTRAEAIKKYCNEWGASKEWVKNHCKVVNLGIAMEDT